MFVKVRTSCNFCLRKIGHTMARKLNTPRPGFKPVSHIDFEKLCDTLRPGDVLLVEGSERVSGIIKYLTQSTWSHAALFIGDTLPQSKAGAERLNLIEVNLHEGCVASPLTKYKGFNLRICRANSLSNAERQALIDFMVGKIGLRYDLRNIFDLLRYFLPAPPVPARWRRRLLVMGSSDPTRAICSTLIAQAFQSIHYPILPEVSVGDVSNTAVRSEIYHIRHHSLFAPRDFDLSPYMEIVKPTLKGGFDFHKLDWGKTDHDDQLTQKR